MLINNRENKLGPRLRDVFSGAGEIQIASAYVGAGAAEFVGLLGRAGGVRVRLVVGRALQDGLPDVAKSYLVRLDRIARKKGGGVRLDPHGFHSKLYATESFALLGSANFTENGLGNWIEASLELKDESAALVRAEVARLWDGGVDLQTVMDEIPPIRFRPSAQGRAKPPQDTALLLPSEPVSPTHGLSISLLDRSDQVPSRSGLNWGFGGGRARNRYEAYVRFPKSVLPSAGYVFGSVKEGTVVVAHTHDGRTLHLRLQGTQSDGKGGVVAKQISTLGENKALGEWLVRDCLGITDRRAVTLVDLRRYGRTSVEFYRTGVDSEGRAVVYLDFSPRL